MYTIAVPTTCTCFKCANIRANKEFEAKIQKKTAHMGFIPRQYDLSIGFNKFPPQYMKGDQVPKNVLDNILHTLEVTLEKNKDFVYKKGKHPVYCGDCGRFHLLTPINAYLNGYVCKSCFDARYRFCAQCHKIERRESLSSVREKIGTLAIGVCKLCVKKFYSKCNRCGGFYKSEHFSTVVINNGKLVVCEHCRANVTECHECGTSDFRDHMHQVENGTFMCNTCMEEQLPIKDYNYKPNPRFQIDRTCERSATDNGEFMGIEWEVENCGTYPHTTGVSKLLEIFGKKYIYCKKDSSISFGFEVVTHPFSYPNFVARRKDWAAAMDTLYELGYRDKASDPNWNKTVGIHIHINKWAFSTTHLYKFMKFFYNPEHRGFMIDISQRGKENYYAKFHPDAMKNLCKSSRYRKNQCKVVDGNDPHAGDYDKNVAVNLKPAPTVEVRLFASTMIPRDFFKNVEFIRSLFLFSKDIPISEVTVPKFLEYCMGREAKTYKNLYTFLCESMHGHLIAHNIKPMYDFSGKGVV